MLLYWIWLLQMWRVTKSNIETWWDSIKFERKLIKRRRGCRNKSKKHLAPILLRSSRRRFAHRRLLVARCSLIVAGRRSFFLHSSKVSSLSTSIIISFWRCYCTSIWVPSFFFDSSHHILLNWVFLVSLVLLLREDYMSWDIFCTKWCTPLKWTDGVTCLTWCCIYVILSDWYYNHLYKKFIQFISTRS